MSRLVFLLEEPSMKVFLEELMPRMFPGVEFLCVTHEGKTDLEKSIPRKLRAIREPGVQFIIVRDNDNVDCRRLKNRLQAMCKESGRPDTLIRLPCQELEAWYIGDPKALALAYQKPKLADLGRRAKFRAPDTLFKPSAELKKLIPEFQKRDGARRVGRVITEAQNNSTSFLTFLAGLRRILALTEPT
jgi:hypothetical protein